MSRVCAVFVPKSKRFIPKQEPGRQTVLSSFSRSDEMSDRIPVSGVSELVLEVADLDRSERFYAEVLGFPVVERWEERGAVWVMAGYGTRIGLWRPQVGLAGGRGGSHVHYALRIEEADFDAAVARLRDRGYEPEIVLFKTDDRGRALYVTDPDDNVVEFWTWDVGEHLRNPASS
jgi:catechol 2,3-dioxygenase-like lactoylglutathione lyase family enzyme